MHDAFPLPDLSLDALRPFWDGAARGVLTLPRCDGCGRLHWYPGPACRRCRGDAFTWDALSGRGRLFSWVVVRHAFLPQFESLVPFVPALITLDEDPAIRLVSRIVGADPDGLAFDEPVVAVFEPLRFPGVPGEVVAPLFRPLSTVPPGRPDDGLS
jgi:uncharacterized OB-fold protein